MISCVNCNNSEFVGNKNLQVRLSKYGNICGKCINQLCIHLSMIKCNQTNCATCNKEFQQTISPAGLHILMATYSEVNGKLVCLRCHIQNKEKQRNKVEVVVAKQPMSLTNAFANLIITPDVEDNDWVMV